MLKCSHCKDPIQGLYAVCKYINAQCPCALHLLCLESAKEDPKSLLRCGCHHSHIPSFTQVEQVIPAPYPNAMEDDDVFIVDAMEDDDVYIVQVIPALAQNTNTIKLFDKDGDLTIITVEDRIKIGQFRQEELVWEKRQTIRVNYPHPWQKPYIYIPHRADEETGNGWYIPSSYSEEMRCFFDALVRDGKLVAEFFRGDVGPKYTATR